MSIFKYEYNAIAIKVEGSGKAISGHHTNFPDGATVFFNSPFQLISWDILPDWEGYYLMFSKEFILKSKYLQNLLLLIYEKFSLQSRSMAFLLYISIKQAF